MDWQTDIWMNKRWIHTYAPCLHAYLPAYLPTHAHLHGTYQLSCLPCGVDTARIRAQPRGRFGRNSLPKLADFSLFWAEGEVKMYRTYREIQNLDQNFSLKSWKYHTTSPCLKAVGWPLWDDSGWLDPLPNWPRFGCFVFVLWGK